MRKSFPSVLMVAAENDLIEGGKVGGVADVIAGISPALAGLGATVEMILPSYGVLHTREGFKKKCTIEFEYSSQTNQVDVYQQIDPARSLTTWIVDHPLFALCGAGNIYCNDPPDRPFASDATKFSFFCNAVAELLKRNFIEVVTHIHLHDWHTAFLLFLKNFDERYQTTLVQYKFIYSIHNLAYQGIRPLANEPSSLSTWWPEITDYDHWVKDPRWHDCINPMRVGIMMSDRLHTVSPTYAQEIRQPSDAETGFYGGEGMEWDINQAAEQGRLVGILNGCDYATESTPCADRAVVFTKAIDYLKSKPTQKSVDELVLNRLQECVKSPPELICTSVGRISSQKIGLLVQQLDENKLVLDELLNQLADQGVLICLGSGDAELEMQLTDVAIEHTNFIFINGFAKGLSEWLYACGELFLMPSQFEPCGISQMLAMREGQPCLVHSVGGLKDTIIDDQNGFVFAGDSPAQQAQNLIIRFTDALKLKQTEPDKWKAICQSASQARFTWQESARQYLSELYD